MESFLVLHLPLSAVVRWGNALDFFEASGKIVGIGKAAVLPDLLHGLVREAQQLLCLADAGLGNAGIHRTAVLLPENPRQIVFVDKKPLTQTFQRQLFPVMLPNVAAHPGQGQALGAAVPFRFRLPCVLHQAGQQLRKPGGNLHIPHVGIRGSQRQQGAQQLLIPGLPVGRAGKERLSARS